MSRARDLVLVTGTPRSGTTVVGDVLAEAAGARYLYEPLNRWVGVRELDHDWPVPGSTEFPTDALAGLLGRISRLDLDLKPGVFPHDEGWRRVAKRVVGSRTTMSYRLCRLDPRLRTVIWKDPFALYVAARVAAAGYPVIVTVRNPWAVAGSFKRLGWSFDAVDLHRRLAEAGRRPSIELRGLGELRDPVTSAAVHWVIAHEHLLADIEGGSALRLVDLDDIVGSPVATYRSLYDHAGLAWTEAVERAVVERYASGGGGSAAPTSTKAHDWRDRDASQVNRYWSDVLTEAEAARVEQIAGPWWEKTQAIL